MLLECRIKKKIKKIMYLLLWVGDNGILLRGYSLKIIFKIMLFRVLDWNFCLRGRLYFFM